MSIRIEDLERLTKARFESNDSESESLPFSDYSSRPSTPSECELVLKTPGEQRGSAKNVSLTLAQLAEKYGFLTDAELSSSSNSASSSVANSGTSTPVRSRSNSIRGSIPLSNTKVGLTLDQLIKKYGIGDEMDSSSSSSSASSSRCSTPSPRPKNFENTGFGKMAITISTSKKMTSPEPRRVNIKSVNLNNVTRVLDSHGGIFSEDEEEDDVEGRLAIDQLTLDQIIQANHEKKMISTNFDYQFSQKLLHLVRDKPSLSSLSLLKIISESETGETIHMECLELMDKGIRPNDYRANRWRVQFSYGDKLEGVGAAPRKLMAKYVAALHLIEKLRSTYPELEIPSCQIPEGCLINPFIFTLLKKFCQESSFPLPIYEIAELVVQNKDENLFVVNCKVGDVITEGCGLSNNYAMRFAAKATYEYFTKRTFQYDRIIAGEFCIGEREYTLGDAESMTTITIPGITQLPQSLKRTFTTGETEAEQMDEGDEDLDFKRRKLSLKKKANLSL